MKFQSIIYTSVTLAASLTFSACGSGDEPAVENRQEVAFEISDCGFGSDSRTYEDGYTTKFNPGDACGLYIVRDGKPVAENVKLTVTSYTEGKPNWLPAENIYGGLPGESYFLYSPYQENITGKVNLNADTDEDFFAPLISGWEVKADQNNAANYTASDLMTAKGTSKSANGTLRLSFSLTHRMALAVIEMPKIHYGNGGSSDTGVMTVSTDFIPGSAIPSWDIKGFRHIVNPDKPAVTIQGVYEVYDNYNFFSITPSGLKRGQYKIYLVDGGNENIIN